MFQQPFIINPSDQAFHITLVIEQDNYVQDFFEAGIDDLTSLSTAAELLSKRVQVFIDKLY